MLLGAIADDLTGGTDLALTLTREGMRTLQVIGVPNDYAMFNNYDAVVVSLKSRTAPVTEAVGASTAAGRALLDAGAHQLFAKYCSTFDSTPQGNIGPVSEALLHLTQSGLALSTPAYPANRRTVYRGHLFVGDVLLSESPMRDHPVTPMRESNLVRLLQAQTALPVSLLPYEAVVEGKIDGVTRGAEGILIADAISDIDLRAIGAAAAQMPVVAGGAGLALGLPENFRRAGLLRPHTSLAVAPCPVGDTVVLAGSCSQTTRGQIEKSMQAGAPVLQIDPLAIASGSLDEDDIVAFARSHRGHQPIIFSSAPPETVRVVQDQLGVDRASGLVEALLARIALRLRNEGFTRFVVAGGETSGAIVSSLGVRHLEIGPEIATGVPWCFADTASGRIALALKSGNFGEADFFARAKAVLE